MFGRLKTFVFGDAAGGAAEPQEKIQANDPAAPTLQSEDRWMKGSKRKRVDSVASEDSGDAPDAATDRTDGERISIDDAEPAAKKAKVAEPGSTILTPISGTTATPSHNTVHAHHVASRKRDRENGVADEGTPSKCARLLPITQMKKNADVQPDDQDGELVLDGGDLTSDVQEGASDPLMVSMSSQSSEEVPNTDVRIAPDLSAGLSNIASLYGSKTFQGANGYAGLLRAAKYNPSKEIRWQAKKYLKQVRPNKAGGENQDKLAGVGAWSGSSAIPGTQIREPVGGEDKIELPNRKPRRVNRKGSLLGGDWPSKVRRKFP